VTPFVRHSTTYQDRTRIVLKNTEAEIIQIVFLPNKKRRIIGYHAIPTIYSNGSTFKPISLQSDALQMESER
jgi:hypothetical protein